MFLVATLANDPLFLSELSGATHVLPRRRRQSPGTQSPFPAGLLVDKPLLSRTLFILVKLPTHPSSQPAAPQRHLPTTRRKMTTFCHLRHPRRTLPERNPLNPPPPPHNSRAREAAARHASMRPACHRRQGPRLICRPSSPPRLRASSSTGSPLPRAALYLLSIVPRIG